MDQSSVQRATVRDQERFHWPAQALHWSSIGLVAASWLSAAIFGIYILAFYLGAVPSRQMEQWNGNLPGIYEPGHPIALIGIGVHFVMGGIILLLGPVQLIGSLRLRRPALHHWVGRIYVTASGVAGLGGLGFILSKGTIGGPVMNVGFSLYGALMVVAAFAAYRAARHRQFWVHRAWAIRLFALAIGSWLYRMDYGFWLTATHGAGHTHDFHGTFDAVMSFFFYVPNLILAELFIHARQKSSQSILRLSTAAILNLATLLVVTGTYYFTRYYWGPSILDSIAGKHS